MQTHKAADENTTGAVGIPMSKILTACDWSLILSLFQRAQWSRCLLGIINMGEVIFSRSRPNAVNQMSDESSSVSLAQVAAAAF